MKKATRELLEAEAEAAYHCKMRDAAQDALDSDKKQRAEIRDLKSRLKYVNETMHWRRDASSGETCAELNNYTGDNDADVAWSALNEPENRNWQKKHICSTRSGDEQVACDDPKCPRK